MVVFEGDGYGDEMAIGYEGVKVEVGDGFEEFFVFQCIITQIDFFGADLLIFVEFLCLFNYIIIIFSLFWNRLVFCSVKW